MKPFLDVVKCLDDHCDALSSIPKSLLPTLQGARQELLNGAGMRRAAILRAGSGERLAAVVIAMTLGAIGAAPRPLQHRSAVERGA